MHDEETARALDALATGLGIEPTAPTTARALCVYLNLVARWNEKLDLTAARTPTTLAEVLFADALVLASDPQLVPRDARLLDVGSGAGAPALPLAILRPDLAVTCLEPRRKRVAFLRTAIGTLGLGRVEVIERRLEPGAVALPGAPFDVALSRATFEPAQWLALAAPLATRVLVLTAREPPPTTAPGLARHALRAYRLPAGGAPRHVGVYLRG